MDRKTETFLLNRQLLIAHPAHLLVGTDITNQLITGLQQIWCLSGGCGSCADCKKIADRQFHNLLWLSSEKTYKREDLDDIFATIRYQRALNDHYFFIIEKAELLSASCANSLLKSLEEPPAGYHFILLAENSNALPETIRSRCIIQRFRDDALGITTHPLFAYFTNLHQSPEALFPLIDQLKLGEKESIDLLEEIKLFWIQRYKKSINDQEKQAHCMMILNQIDTALHYPPMPGSSKLFWKNFTLSWQMLRNYPPNG